MSGDWDTSPEAREDRMCRSKRPYSTKKDAVTAKNHALKNRGRHGRPDGLGVYECPICSNWHLAKRSDHSNRKR